MRATQASSAHTQPLWERVMSWGGHGLAVGGGAGIHFCDSCPDSFGGHSPTGMTCHTKEVRLGKDRWVHAMRDREREDTLDEVEKEVSLSESHRSMVDQNHLTW